MKNYAPINENKDVVTKEYVDNASVSSAEKLTSSAGSSTVPVYFEDGKPKVCAYTLGSMSKESASDYEKAAVTDEKFAAVKNDIALNRTTLGTQCKNLLPFPKSISKGGITFTCDENGYMTASNTTSDARQWAAYNSQYNVKLKPGKYILSFVSASVCTNAYGNIMVLKANDEKIVDIGQTNYYNKTSGAVEFTIDTEQTVYIMSKIFDGKTAIMLRYADITDSTYEPYQPSLIDRCMLKDTAGINLGHAQSDSITIDNLSAYTALWLYVVGNVSGINFATNLIVPVAYLAKSTSNRVQLAGGIPSSAYTTSEGVLAAKYMDGTITAKISGNTLDLTIGKGTIGAIEVISLM